MNRWWHMQMFGWNSEVWAMCVKVKEHVWTMTWSVTLFLFLSCCIAVWVLPHLNPDLKRSCQGWNLNFLNVNVTLRALCVWALVDSWTSFPPNYVLLIKLSRIQILDRFGQLSWSHTSYIKLISGIYKRWLCLCQGGIVILSSIFNLYFLLTDTVFYWCTAILCDTGPHISAICRRLSAERLICVQTWQKSVAHCHCSSASLSFFFSLNDFIY